MVFFESDILHLLFHFKSVRECGIFFFCMYLMLINEDFRKDKITMETKNIQQNILKQGLQITHCKERNKQGAYFDIK